MFRGVPGGSRGFRGVPAQNDHPESLQNKPCLRRGVGCSSATVEHYKIKLRRWEASPVGIHGEAAVDGEG